LKELKCLQVLAGGVSHLGVASKMKAQSHKQQQQQQQKETKQHLLHISLHEKHPLILVFENSDIGNLLFALHDHYVAKPFPQIGPIRVTPLFCSFTFFYCILIWDPFLTIMQAIYDIYSALLQTTMIHFAPFLTPIINKTVECFSKKFLACCLDFIKSCIGMLTVLRCSINSMKNSQVDTELNLIEIFGLDPGATKAFTSLLEVITQTTFQTLQQGFSILHELRSSLHQKLLFFSLI
jgi:hypothetical protein